MKKTLQSWKTFCVASSLVLVAASCKNAPPKWEGKLWAGSSQEVAIERRQDREMIRCEQAEFDDYLCMSYADFQSFYDTFVLGCKEWDSKIPKMTREEIETWLKRIEALRSGGRRADAP